MSSSSITRQGIIAGGNWLIDHVKLLDSWPPQDALANILSESWGNGGGPYNVLKDLARLGASFPLQGVGLVGQDADGRRILEDCAAHGIDTSRLLQTSAAATAYSDVMTVASTGRRTFFYQRGANALLEPGHFDFDSTRARIFHLGYLLLLDTLDTVIDGRVRAAEVFQRARSAGLLTSLDCVSENSDRFDAVVRPVLPDVDILFANDFEAEKLTGVRLAAAAPTAVPARDAVEEAARRLIGLGVRQWAIIHFPEAAYALHRDGNSVWQPSLLLSNELVKGTAGAGDAFASGVLYGLHEGWNMPRALHLGVCAAASSLFDATCSGGIQPVNACLELPSRHPWRCLPS